MYDSIALINNDNYGAPELKKVYQGYTFKGFIIAVTIHIALIAGYMLFVYINQAKTKDLPKNNSRIINVDNIELPPPIDDREIPPVDPKDIVQVTKDLSVLQPLPTRKDLADDVILKTQNDMNKININAGREGDSVVYVSNNGDIKIDDTKLDIKINNDPDIPKNDDRIYNNFEVEKAPECINLSQVRATMNYPEVAIIGNVEGRVTVKILVGPSGNVLKVGTITGPDVFYDEVIDKAANLQFTAGLQNNKPVKVWVAVPFSFKLK